MQFGLGSRQKLCEDCKKLIKKEGNDFCTKWWRSIDHNHNSCFYYSPKEILKSSIEIDFTIYKPIKYSKFLKEITNLKNELKKKHPITHINLPSKKGLKGYYRMKLTVFYPNAETGKNIIKKINRIEQRYPHKLKIQIKHCKKAPIYQRN